MAMRWTELLEFAGLTLIALLAVVLLLPLILLSLQIAAVTAILLAGGLFCSWLYRETLQVYAWFSAHHHMAHRITPRRV